MSEDLTYLESWLPDYFRALGMPWHLAAALMGGFVDDDERPMGLPSHHARPLFLIAQSLRAANAALQERVKHLESLHDDECYGGNEKAALVKERDQWKMTAEAEADGLTKSQTAIALVEARAADMSMKCADIANAFYNRKGLTTAEWRARLAAIIACPNATTSPQPKAKAKPCGQRADHDGWLECPTHKPGAIYAAPPQSGVKERPCEKCGDTDEGCPACLGQWIPKRCDHARGPRNERGLCPACNYPLTFPSTGQGKERA